MPDNGGDFYEKTPEELKRERDIGRDMLTCLKMQRRRKSL